MKKKIAKVLMFVAWILAIPSEILETIADALRAEEEIFGSFFGGCENAREPSKNLPGGNKIYKLEEEEGAR
jgi:hypothetical protein